MVKYVLSGMVALCLLSTPMLSIGETKTEQIEKNFTIDDSKPVFLEFKEGDGDIHFDSWDKNRVLIRVKKLVKERDEKRAAELLNKVKVVIKQDGNSIQVEVQYPKIRIVVFGFNDHPRVEVSTEIMLPVNAHVSCRTDDGNIWGENIQGEVKLRTDDGEINISGIEGTVSVASEDGDITSSGIEGRVEARSDDGDIHLSGRLEWLDVRTEDGDVRIELLPGSIMERDWKIKTDDGDVELFTPRDFAARFRIKTDDGDIESEMPLSFSKISSSRDLSGRMNQGGHTISIETEDGSINLSPIER
jgi:hypothetical protein